MGRNLEQVIDVLVGIIPPEQTNLIDGLRTVRESCLYAPPEAVHHYWQRGSEVLFTNLGANPETEWGKRVQRIWNDDEKI